MKLKEALSKYGEYEVKEQELEKIIEKPKRWEPNEGNDYYYIDSLGDIRYCLYWDNYFDRYRFSQHNVFRTSEEAELSLKINQDFYDNSLKIDKDKHYCKYIIYYAGLSKQVKIADMYSSTGIKYYFKNREIAQSLIDKWGDEAIKKYILWID